MVDKLNSSLSSLLRHSQDHTLMVKACKLIKNNEICWKCWASITIIDRGVTIKDAVIKIIHRGSACHVFFHLGFIEDIYTKSIRYKYVHFWSIHPGERNHSIHSLNEWHLPPLKLLWKKKVGSRIDLTILLAYMLPPTKCCSST